MLLSFKTGPRAGETVEVSGADFTVGRDSSCDLVVDDEKASRRHFAIQALSGAAELSDLGSSNGTFVNGDRIVGSVSLQGGESLRLGGTEFDVIAEPPPASVGAGGADTFVGEGTTAPEPVSAPESSDIAPPPAQEWSAPATPGAATGAPPVPRRRSQKAVWSLICGIAGLIFFGVILGPIAVLLGLQARKEIAASHELDGEGMGLAGIIIGAIATVLGVIAIILLTS